MAGVRSVIHARSTEEINAKYPNLIVWDRSHPNWMTVVGGHVRIDEEPTVVLPATLDEQCGW
jgi:hypothetical protein